MCVLAGVVTASRLAVVDVSFGSRPGTGSEGAGRDGGLAELGAVGAERAAVLADPRG